ncbi:hypothetical protein WJX81_006080 [Elliptochloris bilobata]|uniref:AAA+ ATPase domain-containing protein n=1 Tax=Elliptochloris bilobata TaxID=381761 RepID=A0AAW1SIS8_9CHLO
MGEFNRPAEPADDHAPEASTSDRPEEHELPRDVRRALRSGGVAAAAGGVPLAAINWENLTPGAIASGFKTFKDRVYYGDVLPPVGSQTLSYARFLHLLSTRRIKRVVILGDGKVAMVEIPVEGYSLPPEEAPLYDRFDQSIQYVTRENDEAAMEKYRYYVELPGDLWEDGTFMDLIRMNAAPLIGEDGRMQYKDMLRLNQVHTELVVIDPGESYVWLNQFSDQFVPILALLALRVVVGIGDALLKRFSKPKKGAQEALAEEYGRHRATEFNVGSGAGRRGTGVRYADVAGIDHVKADIEAMMAAVLGKGGYEAIGVRPPRGFLMEGPPGTGKTYLAKAMANESGVPFYSANGAEFVEMFEGVAAARIRDLFRVARKNAPSIVFIDEIDAIGKARGGGGGDAGTRERESGLLQLLYEMDGFNQNDRVLVVGATNRMKLLDEALLRPGRFDHTIYMGRPSTSNRFKILQVHAEGKPLSRAGDAVWDSDALLHRTAELTIGYSGAELANLLNEAAILMVRRELPEIDMSVMREAMDKRVLGLPQARLPRSEAKERLAAVEAARAVAACLTPGMPPVEHVSILPRGEYMARIIYQPQEFGSAGDEYHALYSGTARVNAVPDGVPLAPYEMLCGLLVPLYAGRAAEEAYYGRRGVTLSTSKEVSRAGDLAHWLVRKSTLHPALRRVPLSYSMRMDGRPDPTVMNMEPLFEALALQLQKAAHTRALRLVRERRPVIERVAAELLDGGAMEMVEGTRIVELILAMPPAKAHAPVDLLREASAVGAASFGVAGRGRSGAATFGRLPDVWEALVADGDVLAAAAEVVLGRRDLLDLTASGMSGDLAHELHEELEDREEVERLRAVGRYATSPPGGAPFPPPPADVGTYRGALLQSWLTGADSGVVEVP